MTVLSIVSCNERPKKGETTGEVSEKIGATSKEDETNKADILISEAIQAHGGKLYDHAFYGFTFRNKPFTFHNENGNYTYTLTETDNNNTLIYTLKNGKFNHTLNGQETELSQKQVAKYTEDLNSVVYFATLPHKLNDRAVNKTYQGQTKIKGKHYQVIAVNFNKEGGGIDYEDEFMYWINSETKTMDYLAYKYETNVGGVRFRSAYNPRTIDGIRFQDYINFKAEIGTPLKDLPALYEKGELEELSRIDTENVINLEK